MQNNSSIATGDLLEVIQSKGEMISRPRCQSSSRYDDREPNIEETRFSSPPSKDDQLEPSLTVEYMPNGCLKDSLRSHNDETSVPQRTQWVREAAEDLHFLRSANVIHCDVEPRNFLLEAELSLGIANFSGSSLEGSPASAFPGRRFLSPDFKFRSPPTVVS